MTTIDASEIVRLSRSLEVAASRIPAGARAVVSRGALNIKTDARANVSDSPYWARIGQSINYDMTGNAFHSTATIGYDDEGQGELAGIYEFGSVKRDPHPTLLPAFDREAPRFEKAMGDLAGKVQL